MTAPEMSRDARVVAGRYRLFEQLGHGGMGVVWAGRDELLGRPVAVKEVRLPASVDAGERTAVRERAIREARTTARLDHPCAVRVFDVCEADETAFIVMELIEGRTLAEVVRSDGPLPPTRVAEIGLCLLDALSAAHAVGVVHRDVKPANVLVRTDGRVTLTDFGIASTAGDPSLTSTGLLLGSPAYTAPERARGGSPLPASDLWSLGATLFTAVEGRPPFDRADALATLMSVVTDAPAPCERAGPLLGEALTRLLAKDPAARPDAATLRPLLQAAASAAPAPAGSTAEPPLRVRALAWVALCVAVFLAAGGITALAELT